MTDTDTKTIEDRARDAIYQAEHAAGMVGADRGGHAQARATLAVAWWLRAIHDELREARKAAERRP